MYKILKLFQYISTTFLTTVLLLVTGNYLLWFAHIAARDFYSGPDPRASSPVYENFKGKEKLWKEFHSIQMRFSPYYYWRTKKLSGDYINVSIDGVRKTVKKPNPEAKKYIFLEALLHGVQVRPTIRLSLL